MRTLVLILFALVVALVIVYISEVTTTGGSTTNVVTGTNLQSLGTIFGPYGFISHGK